MAEEERTCRVLIGAPPDPGGGTQRPYVALQTPEGVTTYSLVPEGRPERSPTGGLVAGPGLLLENSPQDRAHCGAALAGAPGHILVQNGAALSTSELAAVQAAAIEPYRGGGFQYGAGWTSCTDLPLATMNAVGQAQQGEREVAVEMADGVPTHQACGYAESFEVARVALTQQAEQARATELEDGAVKMDALMTPVRSMFEFLGIIPEEERVVEVAVEGPGPAGPAAERGGGVGESPAPGGAPREAVSLEAIEQRAQPAAGYERGE